MSPRTVAETLARETDPETSHEAAAATAETLRGVRLAVLELFDHVSSPGLSGSEVNRLYDFNRPTFGWPRTAADSPRKRAGELAAPTRGLLSVIGKQPGENGTPERIYALTDKGRTYLQEHAT